MSVVQPCARCGARWAVQSTPMHWCPRCKGVLLSPAPIDAPAERRNYRWIARRPDQRTRRPASRPGTGTATPKYTQIPRWGLIDPAPQTADAPPTRWQRWTERVEPLLIVTAALFALAAVAELGRYGVLLRNRTRLIEPLLLRASDALVIGSAVLALVFALLAAVALVGWLIEARGAAFAQAGRRDPRSVRTLALGCVIPGVNLLWPGVFLTELAEQRGNPRALRAIRIWWCAWILGGAMAVAAVFWRTADSLQAQADGVMFMVYTDVVAAGVAVLTLWVVRLLAGRDLLGRTKPARRWVVATEAAVPVIEPVQPGAGKVENEDQEVMAK
ncbi:DUF4328 domain-containing protein [Nocardia sp. XZ_19_385]|uniref:DUF4328 domain-containing protein n=1 Tax=Nocardia sp. XZ_19_385 TaxID=2769488 RepID=UPI00188E078B|nr:DUF4328 domain-containing protein [Nocardia sp. XZ_19_385]